MVKTHIGEGFVQIKKLLFIVIILFVGQVVLAQQKSQLKVLQINIWQEGTIVPNGFPAIADEIIAKKADVVLFSCSNYFRGLSCIFLRK